LAQDCGTVRAIYGSCYIRIVSARSLHEETLRASLGSVNGGMRPAYTPRILSTVAHQGISSGMTHAVSQKLSRSDFVQCVFIGNWKVLRMGGYRQLGVIHAPGVRSLATSLLVWGAAPETACGSGITAP
jgi:hypothetical protein